MKSSSVTAKEIKENQGPKWFPWVEHFAAFRRTSAHVVSSSAAAAHLISFLLVLAWGPPARTLPGLRVGAVFSPRRRESRGRKLARSGGACPPSPARLGGPRRWTRLGCSSSAGAAPDVPRLGPGIQPARPGRFRMQMRAAFVAVRLSGSRAFVWGEITAKGFCLAF
ncbi:uncharacterized protein LOC106998852 isoform X1 [Macaca mulatta]